MLRLAEDLSLEEGLKAALVEGVSVLCIEESGPFSD